MEEGLSNQMAQQPSAQNKGQAHSARTGCRGSDAMASVSGDSSAFLPDAAR